MTEVVTSIMSTLVEYNNVSMMIEDWNGTDPGSEPVDPGASSQDIFFNVLRFIFPILIVLIAIIGLTGNLVVLYIIFRNKEMQNITNYFIANLALTDVALLIICALPTAASIAGLPLNVVLCKSINYMQYVSIMMIANKGFILVCTLVL